MRSASSDEHENLIFLHYKGCPDLLIYGILKNYDINDDFVFVKIMTR